MSNVDMNYRLFGLLTRIRQLMAPFQGCGQVNAWLEELDRQMERIGSRRFRVAVVGEFKRGKSSLINTLLQREILPADVLPTTATFNRVVFGNKPRAWLRMKDGTEEEAPIDELARHITKLSGESLAKARLIDEAVVEFPSMFCYDGRELIDTPGLNDNEEMTAVTVSRLREIDLAIVTVAAPYPFSETEAELIARLLETASICQVLFAVTMIDRVEEEDREKLLNAVSERIRKGVYARLSARHAEDEPVFDKYRALLNRPLIYPLSSSLAQKALRLQDVEMYRQSGYTRFTDELPAILLKSQMESLRESVLLAAEQMLNSFMNWLSSCPDEIRQKTESIRALKRSFGAGMYALLGREMTLWKAVSYPDLVQRETEQTEAWLLEARKEAPEGERERMAWLLEFLPALYRRLSADMERARDSLVPRLIGICRDLWDKPFYPEGTGDTATDGPAAALADTIRAASPEALIQSAFETREDGSGDRVLFWWHQPPFPARADSEAFFESLVRAALRSAEISAEKEEEAIRAALEEIHARHREIVQRAVMDCFRQLNEAEQNLNGLLKKAADKGAAAPLQKLILECRELRGTIGEE